jgi:CubicO group peptidase (beta-lactamase class C family)
VYSEAGPPDETEMAVMSTDWTTGPVPPSADPELVTQALRELAQLPEGAGVGLATVVVHNGVIVAEHYAPTAGVDTPLISWSMAKSITQALVGICVADGLLSLDQPAPVAAWADDARRDITIEHLLQMRSGLAWREDYVDAESSDVIEMLFGEGLTDIAAFAAAKPLVHTPGEFWQYSSGTTNILARIVGNAIGGGEAGFDAFLRTRLLDPLGMTGTTARYDPSGTFVGSSFVYASARDFARFGELYRCGGVAKVTGQRVLDERWCARAGRDISADIPAAEPFGYADHWWTWERAGYPGTFAAHGYEGQRLIVSPSRELVVVQLSKRPETQREAIDAPLRSILDAFPESASK